MSRANESALHANEGAPDKVKNKPSSPDPLEDVVDATPADRLGWALLAAGIDPAPLDLSDDATEPGTVWVRWSPTAARGLTDVWWDATAGKAIGRCVGNDDDMQKAAAVLEALTAGGPGDLPLAPPEDPFDPWTIIAATAHRLGLNTWSRPWAMSNGGRLAVNRVRECLARIPVGTLASHLRGTLVLFATFADPDGSNAYPSALTLAETLGLSRSTVSDHLGQLETLEVVGDTGERKSWTQHKHTKIRYIDFAVLDALTGDAPDRQTTDATPDRQTSGTNDGERPTNDGERPTNDAPDRHNRPLNHPLNRSVDESDEYVHDLAVADVARQEAAGEIVVRTNRSALVDKIAREDRARLLVEEAERQANAGADAAIETCSVCDRDGNRWFKHDHTPTIRTDPEAGYSVRCDHADPDDVLEWATGNVMAVFPHAEVIEGTQ